MNKIKNIPFIFFAFLILFAAIFGGLNRLGIQFAFTKIQWSLMHGPLMVCGFLGIVISLERAVALGKTWGYLAPFFNLLGGMGLALNLMPYQISMYLFSIGSFFLVIIFFVFLNKHKDQNIFLMLIGSFFLFLGNLYLTTGGSVESSINSWVMFIIFTIVAERLELSLFLVRSKYQIYLLRFFLFATVCFSILFDKTVFFGGSILGISIWLIFNDIARKTIKKTGLAKYSALCLITGYFWLGFFSVTLILSNGIQNGYFYDTLIHTFFLGFVFLMIFGHAPIIFPSILGVQSVFSPIFYIHFVLMNISLILRIYGNLFQIGEVKILGGIGNSISLALFLIFTMPLVIRQILKKSQIN